MISHEMILKYLTVSIILTIAFIIQSVFSKDKDQIKITKHFCLWIALGIRKPFIRNKDSMKSFSKLEPQKVKKSMKHVKTCWKQ